MAERSQFWEGNATLGVGVGDVGPYGRDQLAALCAALVMDKNGVLAGLAVTASSPAAQSVTVTSGTGMVQGQFYRTDADLVKPIADNTSGNPRIDRVVLRADYTNQTVRVVVIQGTPAASPGAPALTQTAGVTWDEPLAQIAVADSFTTISESDITRERTWARADYPGKFAPCVLAAAPSGWLVCDGAAVSRTTYRDLFDAVGTTFGVGDGSATFNLPDLRGRVFAGLDDMGTSEGAADTVTAANADTLGGTMGEETHTLTVDEMPAHTHPITSSSGGTVTLRLTPDGLAGNYTGYTRSSGGDGAHNNVQPTIFGNFIIKT